MHAFVWVVCVVFAALFFKMAQWGGRKEKHFEQGTENAIAGSGDQVLLINRG
jgi:hypothetical protein